MKRRKIVFAIVGVTLIVALPMLLMMKRRAPLVVFLDGKKPLPFYFPDELNRKPIIDISLPAIGPIRFPKRRAILASPLSWSDLPGQTGASGYLSAGETMPSVPSFLRAGRDYHYLSTVFVSEDPRTRSGLEVLVKLPFATDEEFRDFEAEIAGGVRRRLRLPVSKQFGSSARKAASVQFDELSIHARPRPWKLTTDPVVFDLSVEGGDDRLFLLQVDTLDGRDVAYNTFLVPNPMWAWVSSNAQRPLQKLEGTLFEVQEIPITIEEIPKSGRLEYRIGGRVFRSISGGQVQVEEFGFKAIQCNGKWTGTNPINNRPHSGSFLPRKGTSTSPRNLAATGYRVKNRWAFEMKLDVPEFPAEK